jgi:hypothetical protein
MADTMTTGSKSFLRENAFIVAAVVLPVLVAIFFLAASAVPRWTVPPPAYDLIVKVARPYDGSPSKVTVDFSVRNNRIEATLRPVPPNAYAMKWALLHVDHDTLAAREVPFEAPSALNEGETERTAVVGAIEGTPVSAAATAPDGYALQTRTNSGPGLVGELFGMRSYRQSVALVGRGRTVVIELPAPYREPYQTVSALGWVVDPGQVGRREP